MKHFRKLFNLFFLITVFAVACSRQDNMTSTATATINGDGALLPAPTNKPSSDVAPDQDIGATINNADNSQTVVVVTATTAEIESVPMITIPAGEFIMGSTRTDVTQWRDAWNEDNREDFDRYMFRDELPQMVVYLDTFEIDQVEVSNAHYLACVQANACPPPEYRQHYDPVYVYNDLAYADHPATYITYEMAQTYCQWVGKRLPTVTEWEKAARGSEGFIYPWGNEWDSEKINRWGRVGIVPASASPYGVLDMVGGGARNC